ncbi:unnamed protein product, partial [Mesorhabditis spiculigera]
MRQRAYRTQVHCGCLIDTSTPASLERDFNAWLHLAYPVIDPEAESKRLEEAFDKARGWKEGTSERR